MAKNFPENIAVLESVKNGKCERGGEEQKSRLLRFTSLTPFPFYTCPECSRDELPYEDVRSGVQEGENKHRCRDLLRKASQPMRLSP